MIPIIDDGWFRDETPRTGGPVERQVGLRPLLEAFDRGFGFCPDIHNRHKDVKAQAKYFCEKIKIFDKYRDLRNNIGR